MSGINLAYDSENNYDLNKYRNLSNNEAETEIKNQEQIIIQQKKLESAIQPR